MNYRTDSARHSPTSGPRIPALHSEFGGGLSQKRRRPSIEDGESESRIIQQQRSRSPLRQGPQIYSATGSPTSSARRTSGHSTSGSRTGSSRTSPHMQARGLPAIRSPSQESSTSSRQEWRPTLPGLPALTLGGPPPVFRAGNLGQTSFEAPRSGAHTYPQLSNAYDPPVAQAYPGFPHGYQAQARGQSFSGATGRERTPFSATSHHYTSNSNFAYGVEMAESGNESKQRKRRGNLPKETTDKLRAWFHAHIQHPYPTEDEKQELMRQTGLQMSMYMSPLHNFTLF